MRWVAVTQRVTCIAEYGERRDCLDQQWIEFLLVCGILPILIPNNPVMAALLLKEYDIQGIILTGGNDLADYGGDAPERDYTERILLNHAITCAVPLLGVCRGMQFIQHYFGVGLQPVNGHIMNEQRIISNGNPFITNSFHRFGTTTSVPELQVWAKADDGVIKAVKHQKLPVMGIMWHPERRKPFVQEDIELVNGFFKLF